MSDESAVKPAEPSIADHAAALDAVRKATEPKSGLRSTETWVIAGVVADILSNAGDVLAGKADSVPPEYRAGYSLALMVLGALLAGFNAYRRTQLKAISAQAVADLS